MKVCAFVLRLDGANRDELISAVAALKDDFEAACQKAEVGNFSIWHMQQYLFGYGESHSEDMSCFDGVFAKLPAGVTVACKPGSMRLMYHDIGVVRQDKSLIKHRVFATRIKPGCEEEYKLRHDGLIEKRGGQIVDHLESNFTIWYGDGHIFGYCEKVRAFDREPTPEEHASTVAWETRQLEIMDWLTDDVDWLTGEKHPGVVRII